MCSFRGLNKKYSCHLSSFGGARFKSPSIFHLSLETCARHFICNTLSLTIPKGIIIIGSSLVLPQSVWLSTLPGNLKQWHKPSSTTCMHLSYDHYHYHCTHTMASLDSACMMHASIDVVILWNKEQTTNKYYMIHPGWWICLVLDQKVQWLAISDSYSYYVLFLLFVFSRRHHNLNRVLRLPIKDISIDVINVWPFPSPPTSPAWAHALRASPQSSPRHWPKHIPSPSCSPLTCPWTTPESCSRCLSLCPFLPPPSLGLVSRVLFRELPFRKCLFVSVTSSLCLCVSVCARVVSCPV